LERSSFSSNPLALITGASSGIGAEYARVLARHGYDVLLVGRREDRLQQTQSEIGGQAQVLVADLSTDEGVDRVAERIADSANLDFLVNNAGFGTKGRFFQVDLTSQEQMHRLHVLAPMRLMHAALPGMVARDRGSIVNVSSVAAFMRGDGAISYCATKAWMNSFTEGLKVELEAVKSKVRVQALCPGYTRTDFHDRASMDMTAIPERLWSSPEEVVSASLDGLARNQLFVIPGWHYQLLIAVVNMLPRSVTQGVQNRVRAKFRKDHA
jgi:short-subunit dehydrogenase